MCGRVRLPIPAGVEGDDLSPILRGEVHESDERSALLLWVCSALTWGKKWTHTDDYRGLGAPRGFVRPYRGIRTQTHTYVEDRTGPWLLYDNEDDPGQLRNLAESGDRSAVPPELQRQLKDWLERTGDRFEDTDYYIDRIDLDTGLCIDPAGLRL